MLVNNKALFAPVVLIVLLAITTWVYWPGLPGPFVFDDGVHVSRNTQVHIKDLSLDSLLQAWNSSYQSATDKRPLAQVTFGINHALTGLDTRYFKATNLAIHLLCGLLVFAVTSQLTRALNHRNRRPETLWPALLTTAIWLLHPLNLTPVLYVVQRMTSLSALFVLAGLWCHVTGRLRMSNGDGRGFWLALAGLPIAAVGVLAKESAALYPLLILVLEWSLLRELKAPNRALLLALVSGLPLLMGSAYLATHLGYIDYSGRDFTLRERLITEARVLWTYLRMLAIPDLSALGLYHDDVAVSRSLVAPWTTAPAVLTWLALIPAAILLSKRWPIAGFAVLFFLAGHALESTVFPLELAFEHRNYLPTLGPIFATAWWLTQARPGPAQRFGALAAVLVLLGLAMLTHLRARDWSDENRLIAIEADHHPESPRANFRLAQLLMDQVAGGNRSAYPAAQYYLEKVRKLEPDNLNALFGLMFLDLFSNRTPPRPLVHTLTKQLRHGVVDATKLAIGQLSFLVRWQGYPNAHKLNHEQALAILQAAADNPNMSAMGRASALNAIRAYYDAVLKNPAAALPYAEKAVQAWPQRWHYHYRLVELLLKLGDIQRAQQATEQALQLPSASLNKQQAQMLGETLERAKTRASGERD